MEAPVVPRRFDMTAPAARRPVFVKGVACLSVWMKIPPAATNSDPISTMKLK